MCAHSASPVECFATWSGLISHSVNFRLLANLRGWFYRAVEPLVPGAVEDLKAGDLLARSVQDIETLEDFYVRGIAPPLSAVIVTIGISLFTLQYSIGLSALLAGGLILTGLVLSLQIRSLSRADQMPLSIPVPELLPYRWKPYRMRAKS